MSDLVRLSFSIEQPLVDKLEQLVARSDYDNRSEFIRDMIRAKIVEHAWEADEEAIGTITLVYNHHSRLLNEKLTDLQHDYHQMILATTHVHLDAHLCAEMIMVRGHASDIRQLANLLQQPKGVLHATLSMTSTGKQLL
ncbi:nickel-responsive transcriptional regulator NikR [Beggiatoa leptomitoformis]|uniref:Putative nickel-responsive regulator n=1 Tax=Beggiatoa leptomitoformis TaxID=288004 RepID=A0A2N9YA18_9GAMM|nr:nickel-responsive transcriptional regulator NikR [Beggiatoa leptomitoformis]ALG67273.1 nickel-responsive transcriptional regulator NikR [Beggiatoa leptomitoformis]AUI67302.1 nickel-responsive transcriptional regulator NikR [Beggiatoa leptomitoformis]